MWAKNFKICFLYSDTSVCPSIENQSFPMFFYKKRVSWPRNIWARKLKLSSSLHNFIKSSKHTAAADDAPPCAHEWTRPRRQADGREDGRCWTWQPPPTDPATCTSAGCGSSDERSGACKLVRKAHGRRHRRQHDNRRARARHGSSIATSCQCWTHGRCGELSIAHTPCNAEAQEGTVLRLSACVLLTRPHRCK